VLGYLVRRTAYGMVTVLGVLLLLFVLFFLYASPLDMARRAVGEKAPPEALEQWIVNHGYDRPRVWNAQDPLDTLLVDHFRSMLSFEFGRSDADDTPISDRLRRGLGPSLSLTLPLFSLGLLLSLGLSLFVAYFRETYIDRAGVVICVLGMSISILLYIIGAQYLIGRLLRWFPISGFDFDPTVVIRFLALPIVVGVLSGIGGDVRFYRTVFLEEQGSDYVRTARAKGLPPWRVVWVHALRNALLPTVSVVGLRFGALLGGAVLTESIFGWPGLGQLAVTAVSQRDIPLLQGIVLTFALMFALVNLAVDLTYGVIDPRVRYR